MLQLYINNRPAVIANGTTIRLTRENPMYSTAEDYTFDVTLPLEGCPDNQYILGTIHCPYSLAAVQALPFQLIAPPIAIKGTATVTQISEKEARVQLRSALPTLTQLAPADANQRDTYIDTLPLGCPRPWGDIANPVHPESWRTLPECNGELATYKDLYRFTDQAGKYTHNNIPFPFHRHHQWCRFPYLNNELQLKDDFDIRATDPAAPTLEDIRLQISKTSVGCHPGLLYMLHAVLTACRLHVTTDIPADHWLWNIYILNVRGLDDFNTMLPHWTVEDFAEQVARLLSLRLTRHGDNIHIARQQSTLDRADQTAIPLQSVIDTRTTDIDTSTDTTNDTAHTPFGNIYQLPEGSPLLQVPDEVWENAEIHTHPNLQSIQTFVAKLTQEAKETSRWLFVAEDTGRAYAILSHTRQGDSAVYWELTRVDHLGPYLPAPTPRTAREGIKPLRIVPAQVHVKSDITYYAGGAKSHVALFLPIASDTNKDYTTHYNVDQALNPDPAGPTPPHIDQKPDYIEVFYFPLPSVINQPTLSNADLHPDPTIDRAPQAVGIFPLAIGTPYVPVVHYAHTSTGWTEEATNHHLHFYHPTFNDNNPLDPFSLNDHRAASAVPPYPTLLNEYGCPAMTTATSARRIDTATTITVQFADNIPCDPSSFYHICGRLYACQKIELSLDTEGLHPIKTGYFHPIITDL